MIEVIKSGKRFKHQDRDLTSYWSFSFDYYRDPENVQFGRLRVFNDDVVRPRAGFPGHPHRDMEIVSYVLSGALSHRDSMGNEATIPAGHIQKMSAGSGITHSEMNESRTDDLHFLQVWVLPDSMGTEPSYSSPAVQPGESGQRVLEVVTPDGRDGTAPIDADVTFSIVKLPGGETVSRDLGGGRMAHLFVIEGALHANAVSLSPGDAARVRREDALNLMADEAAHALLVDLPPD